MSAFRSIEWLNEGIVRLLDQRLLPQQTIYNDYTTALEVAKAIKEMVVRGAPAIGATAAYGLVLTAVHTTATNPAHLRQELSESDAILRQSRPTAVNLFWALDRMQARLYTCPNDILTIQQALLDEAHTIATEDVQINRQIGLNALPLIPDKATIIHHCNTGSLATVDYGTALGIIRTAHEHGKQVKVLVDETRPRLQGARLTAWELQQQGIPFQIIVDGASGYFMKYEGVDLCVVGADRVAANGDVANKIGTYNLALVAHAHGVPFYVAAPTTTIDLATKTGDEIEVEQRPLTEITHIGQEKIAPDGAPASNPAFDITPAKYVTAVVTEKGVITPPFLENFQRLFDSPSFFS